MTGSGSYAQIVHCQALNWHWQNLSRHRDAGFQGTPLPPSENTTCLAIASLTNWCCHERLGDNCSKSRLGHRVGRFCGFGHYGAADTVIAARSFFFRTILREAIEGCVVHRPLATLNLAHDAMVVF